jgi:hypothetical protein
MIFTCSYMFRDDAPRRPETRGIVCYIRLVHRLRSPDTCGNGKSQCSGLCFWHVDCELLWAYLQVIAFMQSFGAILCNPHQKNPVSTDHSTTPNASYSHARFFKEWFRN